MSTNALAETVTAATTENEEAEAPVIPGRDEVLKDFARDILGEPETAAPSAEAETENADEALTQTEAEAKADGETETETGAEENHLEDDLRQDLPEDVQEKINRRIGKEVAKTKLEREAREQLEAKLAEAETKLAERVQSPKANVPSPLSDIHDPAKLEAEKLKAEAAMEQAEDLMDQLRTNPSAVEAMLREAKVELKDETGEADFSPERMEAFLRTVRKNADRSLRRSIPEREKFLKAADQAASQAVEFMPELKDPKTAQAKLFRQALQDLPEIQKHPQWPLMAVIGVLGRQKLDELIAAKKKLPAAPAKRELPVKIPTPRAQPASVPRTKPAPVDANAMAEALLNGNKSRTRMDYIKTFVPKG
jgi:hypothetical protein